MNELLYGLGIALLGGIIVPPLAKFLGGRIKLFLYTNKLSLKKAVLEAIKDEELRAMVKGMIENAENTLDTEQAEAKFSMVKTNILKLVPDMFDPLVDGVIQAIYDAMKEDGEIVR